MYILGDVLDREKENFALIDFIQSNAIMRLNEGGSYRIVHRDRFMCIDSGAGHRKQGGKMSCYCIETAYEAYL